MLNGHQNTVSRHYADAEIRRDGQVLVSIDYWLLIWQCTPWQCLSLMWRMATRLQQSTWRLHVYCLLYWHPCIAMKKYELVCAAININCAELLSMAPVVPTLWSPPTQSGAALAPNTHQCSKLFSSKLINTGPGPPLSYPTCADHSGSVAFVQTLRLNIKQHPTDEASRNLSWPVLILLCSFMVHVFALSETVAW